MRTARTVHADDENQSLSSITNSDEDNDKSSDENHRACNRYASCNKTNHKNLSINRNVLKPEKGTIRSIDNVPTHRQKYDGSKWRRICCFTNCSIYLNGKIYSENWLCRKHYLLSITNKISEQLEDSINEKEIANFRLSSTRQKPNQNTESSKRGDIRTDINGTRQKYDGRSWRLICTFNDNCKSFAVAHDFCHRHNRESRKNDSNLVEKLSKKKSSNVKKPKKGDIKFVRQQWNGSKWYSLCNYYTQQCTRRSGGIKHANLCDLHYKEYQQHQFDQNLVDDNPEVSLTPKTKRTKLNDNHDHISNSNTIDVQNDTTLQQTQLRNVETTQQNERSIQTDFTCPFDSNDLNHGCLFIDDDDNNSNNNNKQCQEESILLLTNIKKEEDNSTNNGEYPHNINSSSINCKLEITKHEI